MSSSAATIPTVSAPPAAADPPAEALWDFASHAGAPAQTARGPWIVSPLFDLVFFANLLWVLALFPFYVTAEGVPYVAFWAAYFIATPHRWMTLILAFGDSDRRGGRTWLFVLIALVMAVVVIGVYLYFGSYMPLGLIYTVLIGWHFASQHSGVLRIYSRKSGGGRRVLETWPVRLFILYATVRMMPGLEYLLRDFLRIELAFLDAAVIAIPVALIALELIDRPWRRIPKLLYLLSIGGIYSTMILSVQRNQLLLLAAMLTAATIFHSAEYLALASYYAQRRQRFGSNNAFRRLARHWPIVFGWFAVSCGLIYSFGDARIVVLWFGINLWASFLHCIYDGMMWRLRDPKTAEVLGLTE